jgi:hypothetical protein
MVTQPGKEIPLRLRKFPIFVLDYAALENAEPGIEFGFAGYRARFTPVTPPQVD